VDSHVSAKSHVVVHAKSFAVAVAGECPETSAALRRAISRPRIPPSTPGRCPSAPPFAIALAVGAKSIASGAIPPRYALVASPNPATCGFPQLAPEGRSVVRSDDVGVESKGVRGGVERRHRVGD
jgi:hypothetical protein